MKKINQSWRKKKLNYGCLIATVLVLVMWVYIINGIANLLTI